jgi:hypothetical protein
MLGISRVSNEGDCLPASARAAGDRNRSERRNGDRNPHETNIPTNHRSTSVFVWLPRHVMRR